MTSDFSCELIPFPEQNFFLCKFRGELDLKRLGKAHQSFTNHSEYKPWIDELLDFSEASIRNLSKDEIGKIQRTLMNEPTRHGARSVMVINTEPDFQLLTDIGEAIGEEVYMERQVCLDLQSALEWLRPNEGEELAATLDINSV